MGWRSKGAPSLAKNDEEGKETKQEESVNGAKQEASPQSNIVTTGGSTVDKEGEKMSGDEVISPPASSGNRQELIEGSQARPSTDGNNNSVGREETDCSGNNNNCNDNNTSGSNNNNSCNDNISSTAAVHDCHYTTDSNTNTTSSSNDNSHNGSSNENNNYGGSSLIPSQVTPQNDAVRREEE